MEVNFSPCPGDASDARVKCCQGNQQHFLSACRYFDTFKVFILTVCLLQRKIDSDASCDL